MVNENFDDLNKPNWKPKFQSEYSMGDLDFHRYDEHLKFIERFCGIINSKAIPDLEDIQNYFAGLNTLYKLWRPIIAVPTKVNELDNAIKTIRKEKRVWERSNASGSPFSTVLKLKISDELDSFHTRLMEMKQLIGLGIVVKRNLSMREKIRDGIKGYSGKLRDLPEA